MARSQTDSWWLTLISMSLFPDNSQPLCDTDNPSFLDQNNMIQCQKSWSVMCETDKHIVEMAFRADGGS